MLHVQACVLTRRRVAAAPCYIACCRVARSDLSNNSLHGSLPLSWSNLTSLEVLDLSRNALTGPLPPTWSSFTALQSLDLHLNALTGPLPPSWASMSLLQACARAQDCWPWPMERPLPL